MTAKLQWAMSGEQALAGIRERYRGRDLDLSQLEMRAELAIDLGFLMGLCARLLDQQRALGIAQLNTALEESVRLQNHYAKLLNMHDGGQRLRFRNVAEWLARLRQTGTI